MIIADPHETPHTPDTASVHRNCRMGSIRSLEVLSIYYSDHGDPSDDMHYIHPTRSPGFRSIPRLGPSVASSSMHMWWKDEFWDLGSVLISEN